MLQPNISITKKKRKRKRSMLFTGILPISPCFTCSRSLSLYRDQSFNTLSGSGHRGADFNYSPTKETDHVITTTEIFNQDSGGHYL